ncbi:hypothetical protein GH714_032384 [Hevea brasiliensis]|uniref:Uncharacterized protein n=1 Tax=Hevea brasiliensis TaxID=3981 RepID=A0A6A6K7Y3_HEVBR|nr:hypothetical protein GH714_032384 [Hevea brasiliensis]
MAMNQAAVVKVVLGSWLCAWLATYWSSSLLAFQGGLRRRLSNASFADCAKRDPEVSEDTEKNFAELLTEELKLREAEALENQQRADMALLEAKKMTSQYQKEADKCNSGWRPVKKQGKKLKLH